MSKLALYFLLLLGSGVPIAFVLMGAAAAHIVFNMGVPWSVIPQRIFTGLDQFVLMSIPFFILAGLLMNEAKLTERLVEFSQYLVGNVRGGLAHVNVVTSMFFAGITGAATADTAAVGSILIPAMVKDGYRKDFATAVTVASSTIGPLIPPSIPALVYGIASGTSIGQLFLAGVVPGVLVGLTMLVVNNLIISRTGMQLNQAERPPRTWRGFFSVLRTAAVALMMPLIIVGGVTFGVFTPTEASAVAALYALIVGVFVFRTIKLPRLLPILIQTAVLSAVVLFVVASANLMGWVLSFERVPQTVADAVLSVTNNPYVFGVAVMIILLIAGLFLEPSGAIIILTPVLYPVAMALGYDPVHFGMIMVFGLVIGLITPPVGLCLFVGCSISGLSLDELVRATWPYLIQLILMLALVVFVPELSLWLPRLIMR